MLDTTYGNISTEEAERIAGAVAYPSDSLVDTSTYIAGTAEPWIAQLVAALLTASGKRTVLETGGFTGTTSLWLGLTLEQLGGGTLHVAEIDPERAHMIDARLAESSLERVKYRVYAQDVLQVIHHLDPKSIGLVWLDDDHGQDHVEAEIRALIPKIESGGLIVGHDVYGSCNLQKVFHGFGGYALDFPRCGPAGGIGILQL